MRFYFSGTHPSDVLKMPSLTRGTGNGYWLDASTGGMVWRQTPSGDTIDMQKDQIDDYAPVCLTNNSADGSNNTNERGQQRECTGFVMKKKYTLEIVNYGLFSWE
uniref:Uncharacterized protein n=1 Tax=Glossina brevipalpis TaxID=37001 RepID=A0A1A9VZK0_9MUSC